jgi:alginate O-acetyltransferase complex protein AlgI
VIFNSFIFLFFFLPVVILLFMWRPMHRHRPVLLIAASFLFYAYAGILHASVLAIEVLIISVLMHRLENGPLPKLRYWLAVITPVLVLGYFKYAGFVATNIQFITNSENSIGHSFSLFRDVALPAGISFFTFQLISFSIDRRRGRITKSPPFSHLALYITFFPQLVAGPILRFDQVREPISRLCEFMPKREDVVTAIGYISFGLALKVLIADVLGGYIDVLNINGLEALNRLAALYILLAYSFEIYFDFYGYSLIAIGLGRLFGFHFPDNFLRPYEALNPKDFWRRWHVTLSQWLRDYVYLGLGGNRAYARNILVVFAACGLWHGAGWNFIVWGLYHAVLVLGYGALRSFWDKMPTLIQISVNFTLVSFGWLLFLYDFSNAGRFIEVLITGGGSTGINSMVPTILLAIATLVCFTFHPEKMAIKIGQSKGQATVYLIILAVISFAILLGLDRSRDFIYFRF